MIPRSTVIVFGMILLWGGGVAPADNGFERAISAARARSVKLYGLKVGQQVGYGTGTIVSAGGDILTVYSLLLESNKLRAVTSDGTRYHAELVTFDRRTQLALIKMTRALEGDSSIGSLPFFDLVCSGDDTAEKSSSDPCEPELLLGDWVLAAGNPFKIAEGAEPVSIAHGVYSARARLDARRKVREFPYHGDVLVIDAVTSNPGAPGSPLVNLDGKLVGMIGRLVVSNLTHTKFDYAIPRDVLRSFLIGAKNPRDSVVANTDPSGPTRRDGGFARVDPGIRLTRTGYMKLPPLVERVRRGSPAAKAGVRPDDLILSINGHRVADLQSYDKRIAQVAQGEPIDLVIQRKKNVITIRIPAETP